MVRPRVVGLNLPSGVRRPDRSVSPNVPVPNFQGPQVHAMAGDGPPNWQEDLPLGDRPGRRLTPAQMGAGEAGVETAKGILEGTVEPPPEPVETPEPPPPVQDELFPDPEARSLDDAMLQELFLQRASEPDYGYFGRTGDKVGSIIDSVGDMSASDRAALVGGLIAAGVLMVGSGGTLIPAGAALLGGAGLGALTSAP